MLQKLDKDTGASRRVTRHRRSQGFQAHPADEDTGAWGMSSRGITSKPANRSPMSGWNRGASRAHSRPQCQRHPWERGCHCAESRRPVSARPRSPSRPWEKGRKAASGERMQQTGQRTRILGPTEQASQQESIMMSTEPQTGAESSTQRVPSSTQSVQTIAILTGGRRRGNSHSP
jgi:hypothetical protein